MGSLIQIDVTSTFNSTTQVSVDVLAKSLMSGQLDEETEVLRRFSQDTAAVHEACLLSFKGACDRGDYLANPKQLRFAVNCVCKIARAECFMINEEESEELFMKDMNFAAFFGTVKDYFSSALQAMCLSEAFVSNA